MNATTDAGPGAKRAAGQSVAFVHSVARRRRLALQAKAAELLPGERVAHCCKTPFGSVVDIVRHPVSGAASFSGLQTCGSVWACPVCASKISERRRVELASAVQSASDRGLTVLLVTYTLRHRVGDTLRTTLEGLTRARKRLLSGRRALSFNKRYGVVGRVRALEVTHGVNGWHPHIHELLFLGATEGGQEGAGGPPCPSGADWDELLNELREAWLRCVRDEGLRDVNDHGVDVRFADMAVAEYVAKFGRERSWGPEHELAKQVTKRGRAGSRTPTSLLCDASRDEIAAALWVEYARVSKGRRQLTWSRGLRELLGMRSEQTDEELAAEEVPGAVHVFQLEREEWLAVIGNDARGELLEAAEQGGSVAIAAFLRRLLVTFEVSPRLEYCLGDIM